MGCMPDWSTLGADSLAILEQQAQPSGSLGRCSSADTQDLAPVTMERVRGLADGDMARAATGAFTARPQIAAR